MTDLYGVQWLPLPRAPEMAEIERRAREEQGIPERVLMENAGRTVAQVTAMVAPEGRVVGVIGSGQNGGDAYIALRTLQSWGRDVLAVQAGAEPPDPVLAHRWTVPVAEPEGAIAALATAGIILDGILGTGAAGAPKEPQAALIESVNTSGAKRIAVDGPSGADFSTGAVPGACIQAHVTVTLGFPKLGLLFQPARSHCGRILSAELGFPPVGDNDMSALLITPDWAKAHLPERLPDAHKGLSGYLLVVAGRMGMGGTAVLTARGALAMGAGIVRIASDEVNRVIAQTSVPEAIFLDVDDDAALPEAGEWAHAVVVGPGLGHDRLARERLDRALAATGTSPVLLDADGLNLFAGRRAELTNLAKSRAVAITPHPGEMARLLEVSVKEVLADPVAVAAAAAGELRAAVLLKGAPSVVALSHQPVLVSSITSSATATGGSGDLLSGACGALLAARMPRREALGTALFYCGRAAQLGPSVGRSSLDMVSDLPAALRNPGASTPPLPFVQLDQPPPS